LGRRSTPALKHEVRFASKIDLQADLAGVLSLALKTAELQNETRETNLSGLVEAVSSINAELIAYLKLHPEGLYTIEPRQFEEIIAELLANFGWEVDLTPKTKDGGYDIFAIAKNIAPNVNAAWIIECKRYMREKKVGVEIVRALYGAKSSFDGVNAMLATTSSFTQGARKFKSSRYNLELRDYAGVVEWLEAYRLNPGGTLYIQNHNQVLKR
jgi:restriction system protein